MALFVDVEALNLRSEPVLAPDNRLAVLPLGQRVEPVGPPDHGWQKLRTRLQGVEHTGFVQAQLPAQPATGLQAMASLRADAGDAREALVQQALKQWLRFERGLGHASDEPYFAYVGQMWQALGLGLTGRDADMAWSAAALSYMVRQAAAAHARYGQFRFAPCHARYLHQSIVARHKGDKAAPFWGMDLYEALPQVGDVLASWCESPLRYADAAASDAFKSHAEVIVSVRPDEVLSVGANVQGSVALRRHAKQGSGHLAAADGVFMLMVNRA